MNAARALFFPAYEHVIDYDGEADFCQNRLVGGAWKTGIAAFNRLGPHDWNCGLTFSHVGGGEEEDCEELQQLAGKLLIARYYTVSGQGNRAVAFGPRHVELVKREDDTYRVILAWPRALIPCNGPLEFLGYAFRPRGQEQIEYVYQTDQSGTAAFLAPFRAVHSTEKKMQALMEALMEIEERLRS